MTRFRIIVAAVTLAAISAACGKKASDTPAVPRPVAYPRITLYDSAYKNAQGVPIHFEIQDSAVYDTESGNNGSVWLNVRYPAYRATLHCTFSPVTQATVNNVIANRLERVKLNTGSYPAEVTELTSPGGYDSQIFFTRTGSLTPLQFISAGPEWVVSGALYMEQPGNAPDSVAPVLQSVYRDIIHAAKTVR